MTTLTDEQRRQAIGRIQAKRSFSWHVVVFVLVNIGFVAIWFFSGQGYYWPIWPMLGWGIGLIAHGLAVYGGMRPITEEQIQREIDKSL